MDDNYTGSKEGRKISRKMSKPAPSTHPIFKNDALHLAFCVVGVVGSLLLYGVLQVCVPALLVVPKQ